MVQKKPVKIIKTYRTFLEVFFFFFIFFHDFSGSKWHQKRLSKRFHDIAFL